MSTARTEPKGKRTTDVFWECLRVVVSDWCLFTCVLTVSFCVLFLSLLCVPYCCFLVLCVFPSCLLSFTTCFWGFGPRICVQPVFNVVIRSPRPSSLSCVLLTTKKTWIDPPVILCSVVVVVVVVVTKEKEEEEEDERGGRRRRRTNKKKKTEEEEEEEGAEEKRTQ